MKHVAVVSLCAVVWGAGCVSAPPPQAPVPSSPDDGMNGDAWRWFEQAEWLQQGLEAAERWAVEGPKEVAIVAGLPETASLDLIASTLHDGVAAKLAAAGGKIYVEVRPTGAGPGDVPVADVSIHVEMDGREGPEARQLFDAVGACVSRVAGLKVFLQERYAGIGRLRAAGEDLREQLRGTAAERLARNLEALATAELRLPATIAELTRIEARFVGALTGNE
jgi:hypothetical protein